MAPFKCGTTHSPRSTISRATAAYRVSSGSQRSLPPSLKRKRTAPMTRRSTRYFVLPSITSGLFSFALTTGPLMGLYSNKSHPNFKSSLKKDSIFLKILT